MTRYELFRRRIAPIAFLVVVGLIAYDACHKQHRNHATITIDLGAAAPRVTALDAELSVDGEVVGRMRRTATPAHGLASASFEALLPKPDGELRVEVELGGARRTVTRRVHAEEGARVTVSIGAALDNATPR